MSIAQAQKMKELERRISELEALLLETRKEMGRTIARGVERYVPTNVEVRAVSPDELITTATTGLSLMVPKRKPGRPPKNG